MRLWRPTLPILVCVALTLGRRAADDDSIVIRAMTATTIAEVFVNDGEIRRELEIGIADLRAFRNVLPDDLHERPGFGSLPLGERLGKFLHEDWVRDSTAARPGSA